MAFDQAKYQTEFNKERYDTILLRINKGKKQELKEYADCNDISLNELIKRALTEYTDIQF